VLRAEGRTTLWLESEAAILRGREVMKPEEADTPARLLYFTCMMAYLDPKRLAQHQHDIILLLGDLIKAFEGAAAKASCAAFAREVAEGNFYRALAECRALIDHEAAALVSTPRAAQAI
jgi:flagellar biosynthesis repressor protein FlbT